MIGEVLTGNPETADTGVDGLWSRVLLDVAERRRSRVGEAEFSDGFATSEAPDSIGGSMAARAEVTLSVSELPSALPTLVDTLSLLVLGSVEIVPFENREGDADSLPPFLSFSPIHAPS